ncbi:MAG: hypothetical protein JW803_00030 [Endomicrobiales bacterium]|nr:hypothetical protein [Endomicrobiales bacterium]
MRKSHNLLTQVLPSGTVLNRFLAGFIFLCIAVNGLVPRFAMNSQDAETLSKIMQNQSVLLSFFSFSTLPVKIVNELMAQNMGVKTSADKNIPAKDAKNTANTSTDYSLTGADIRTNSRIISNLRSADLAAKFVSSAAISLKEAPRIAESSCLPGGTCALLMLMMFFLILARSALPADASIMFYIGKKISRLATTSRDFYLSITIINAVQGRV